ncbi:DUF1064 domain-containing protein [Treponema pedis]|uniref:DUF1064 domain-containing protein n=1 Tax=Treponema pedis TaxID=409322 RepID=UPI00042770E8|nr:DUF1064 domain-containing protein [Treponema pedis]
MAKQKIWENLKMSFYKQHKYKVASKDRRTADGIVFASRSEMKRYQELKMLEKAGVISDLELQPKFLLVPATEKGGKAVHYVADFAYIKDGQKIYEDVKGVQTEVYKLKKKLLLWQYPDIYFYENKV